ncbi:MAG: patatin-like phospholipase family protein [Candidatus Omnitrophota bacterium]
MEPIDKDLILRQIPLFEALSAEESELVKPRSEIIEYGKNQVVYEEGSPADAFYCVVLGRVVIYTRDPSGNETILEYLHRGKYFGIISLLTNDSHSVSARTLNDSALLVIKKEDFDFILKSIPRLAIDLSLTLSRRLKNKSVHQKTIFESTIASVFSSYSQAGKTVYALNLALSLHKESCKSVLIIDICAEDAIHSLPQKLGVSAEYKVVDLSALSGSPADIVKASIVKSAYGADLVCITYAAEDESSLKKLLAVLSQMINDYHYIILDLPSSMDQFVLGALNQSDFIHILTSPQAVDLKKTHNLINRLKDDFHFQEAKIRVVINEYKLSKINYQEQREIVGFNIHATLPRMALESSDRLVLDDPLSEYAKAVRRISRQLADNLVGLALGIGVGYGFCHIGVLKVIEEENIPIDVISGSSIGSLIASLWATGRSAQEILEIIKEEFKQPKYTWGLIDLTFPSLGFIRGNKLYKFLKKYLGSKTFYDVRLPLKIIASDIRNKEPRVLDKGLLIDAIMASCAMPGVFQPFKLKEELLLDGGVINPLPTEVLFKMGIRKIIAVNVTPSREDILKQYESLKEQFALAGKEIKKGNWFNLKHYLQKKFRTNILDIIFSSVELMQSEIIRREVLLADVVLHPDTSGLHWLELYRAVEFAQRGEKEARANLDRIKQMLNE